jgi:hypothetical protein
MAPCPGNPPKIRTAFAYASLIIFAATTPGCSVYMEATRPTPVDLTQFQAGQSRDAVVESIGTPIGTTNESDGDSCDSYQLYTHGYGAGGKAGLAVLEGAADVFTLGIAEAVTTPVEGATKNEKRPVLFCYKDGKLARLTESGKPLISSTPVTDAAPVADAAQATPNGAPQSTPASQSGNIDTSNPAKSTSAAAAAPTQPAKVAKVTVPAAAAPVSAAPAFAVSPAPAVKPAVDWQPVSPATE